MSKRAPFIILLIISLTTLLFSRSFGQRQFAKGYIILHNNDTLHGFIAEFSLESNPKRIIFKSESNAKSVFIPIKKVKKIVFDDQQYILAYVKVDSTGNYTNFYPKYGHFHFPKDTVLLQVLVLGPKSLYRAYYKERNLFYIKQKDKITLLQAPVYTQSDSLFSFVLNKMVNVKGLNLNTYYHPSSKHIQLQTYKYQLAEYLGDNIQIYKILPSINYNLPNLLGLFLTYYKTLNKKPLYHFKTLQPEFNFGIMSGLHLMKAQIFSNQTIFYYVANIDYPISYSPYLAAFWKFTPWQYQYKFSLLWSMGLSKFSSTGTKYVDLPQKQSFYYTKLLLNFANINLALQYAPIVKPIRIYTEFGLNYDIILSSNSYTREISYYKNSQSTVIKTYDPFTPRTDNGTTYLKNENGIHIGLGAEIHHIGFELIIERATGFMNPLYMRHVIWKGFIILTYNFL
jgi:hypothetical protein